jgi:hypothetical protein
MTPSAYPENAFVQQTTAEFLKLELGLQTVCAYNYEIVVT